MRHPLHTLLALALVATSAQAIDIDALIQETPCLPQLRAWLATGGAATAFQAPSGLSTEQCARAREINESGWFRHELEVARREQAWQASEAAQAKRLRDMEEATARESREYEAASQRQLAAMQRQRAALAKKPVARLGMTREVVIAETRWGKPIRRSTVTSATGVTETLFYGERGALVFTNGQLTSIHEY